MRKSVEPFFVEDLLVGTVIANRYKIIKLIDSGGNGVIYEASDLDSIRRGPIAVKVTKRPNNKQLMRIRRNEILLHLSLDHSNIIKCYEIGGFTFQGMDMFYIVMDMAVESLADRLRDRLLDLNSTVQLVRNIAAAIDYIHDLGLVHRDIKPSNILFADGVWKLADMGLLREIGYKTHLTQHAPGTMKYIPPEGLRARAQISLKWDIYSLGVVAVQAYTGKVTEPDMQTHTIMVELPKSHLVEPANRLPEPLGSIVQKCMQYDRADRCTASELLQIAYRGKTVHNEHNDGFPKAFSVRFTREGEQDSRSPLQKNNVLNKILSSGQIIVGVVSYPPLSDYEISSNGILADGLYKEIIEVVAKDNNLQVKYSALQWSQIVDAVKSGKVDMVLSVFETRRRRRDTDFAAIMHKVSVGGIVAKGRHPEIRSEEDLRNRNLKIAVTKGEIGWEYALSDLRLKGEGDDNLTIIDGMKKIGDTFWQVIHGNQDIAIADALTCSHFVKTTKNSPVEAEMVFQNYPLEICLNGIMVKKYQNELRDWLNENVQRVRDQDRHIVALENRILSEHYPFIKAVRYQD